MPNNQQIIALKTKLQSLGALRPEAWERILQLSQHTNLKTGESLIRKEGTLAYMIAGLLKEYDAQHRKSPSIINFIASTEALLTRRSNQHHYLKACLSSSILYWNIEQLQTLYQEYPELKTIYDGLIVQYDQRMQLRMRLLELPVVERIATFSAVFKPCLPYLKKIDIANYLHFNYTHFLKYWNS